MALVKWEPFGGLSSLRKEMDRVFDDFLHVGSWPVGGGPLNRQWR
jgi:hypothetical protein